MINYIKKNNLKLLFIIAVLFASCSEDTQQELNSTEIDFIQVNIQDVAAGFNSEMAVFKDQKEFESFLYHYSKMNKDLQSDILANLNYFTVRDFLDGVYDEMDNYTIETEFQTAVENSKGLLFFELNEEGYLDINETVLSKHLVRSFLNEDQIVKVGDRYLKYIDKYEIIADNTKDLNKIKNVEEMINSNLKFTKVWDYIGNSDLKWGDLGDTFIYQAINNNSGCKNDRMVIAELKLFASQNGSISTLMGELDFRGRRKTFLCGWRNYKTDITWQNIDCVINFRTSSTSSVQSFNWIPLDGNATNTYGIEIDETFFGQLGSSSGWDAEWDQKQLEVTTTGMAGDWLIVND